MNLSKKYKTSGYVLNNINARLDEPGKIYGLIGPNGTGKTTLVRILATQLVPTSGTAQVLGFDIATQKKEIRRRISVLPQDITPFMYEVTLFDYIYYYLKARGYSRKTAKERALTTIDIFGLNEQKNKAFGRLSGGYIRRSYIAMALAVDADIYFLDEPTVGLDPSSRFTTWNILENTAADGKTIFLTSHYMEEISKLCNTIMVLHKSGKLLDNVSPKTLMTEHFPKIEKKIIIPAYNYHSHNINSFRDLQDLIEAYGKYYNNNGTIVSFPADYWKLAKELTNKDIVFEIADITLEDIVIYLDRREQ